MQPPPGYPKQPQGQPSPHSPQQAPPGYPPQYGIQQQPYYPPQKKGMPGWAWGLIVGAIVLFCGFPVLGILLLPLVTSNTRDARRAEGEQVMGVARDSARVQYSKTGQNPGKFSSFMSTYELSGHYYNIDDPIRDITTGGRSPSGFGGGHAKAEITCTPVTPSDGKGRCEFSWSDGNSQIRWD
jgi:hypothetical protein